MEVITKAEDQHNPASLLESVLSLLEQHTPALTLPARQRAATAFMRSLEWMEANPASWEIKPVQPITYIEQLDKPMKTLVRGPVVDIYKAVTI